MTDRLCTFPGCEKKYDNNGLCKGHASQRRRGGGPLKPIRPPRVGPRPTSHNRASYMKCGFPPCDGNVFGLGLCNGHYRQAKAGRELAPLLDPGCRALFDSSWTAVAGTEDATFQIRSPRYGDFTVVVPARFKADIRLHKWHVVRSKDRVPGRDFTVTAKLPDRPKRQRVLQLHVFIWALLGKAPVAAIDHRDGQPLNNAEGNLRDGTIGNAQNLRSLRRGNTSGIVGVRWEARYRKWSAKICVRNKARQIGLFVDRDDAQIARDAAALELHGEFAVLNPPVRAMTEAEYREHLSAGSRRGR